MIFLEQNGNGVFEEDSSTSFFSSVVNLNYVGEPAGLMLAVIFAPTVTQGNLFLKQS